MLVAKLIGRRWRHVPEMDLGDKLKQMEHRVEDDAECVHKRRIASIGIHTTIRTNAKRSLADSIKLRSKKKQKNI